MEEKSINPGTFRSELRRMLLPIFPPGFFTRARVRLALFGTVNWRAPIEQEELDLGWLSQQMPPAKLVLEVGANNGADTLRLLKAFPLATVHCFEPDPRAQKKWESAVSDPRASLHRVALGHVDGTVRFFQSDHTGVDTPGEEINGWSDSSSIHPPRAHLQKFPWVSFEKEIEVACEKLDTFVSRILEPGEGFVIDFIWADVQGAERELILGGIESFAHVRFIYTEYSNQKLYESQIGLREILRLLPNFKIRKLWEGDVLLENMALSEAVTK